MLRIPQIVTVIAVVGTYTAIAAVMWSAIAVHQLAKHRGWLD